MSIFTVFVLGHKDGAKLWVVGHNIVHSRSADNAPDGGMRPDILYSFAKAIDYPTVVQAFQILLDCSNHDNLLDVLGFNYSHSVSDCNKPVILKSCTVLPQVFAVLS